MKVYILRSNNPKDVINMIYINKENADANCKELNKISSDWYVEERETIDNPIEGRTY